MSTAIPDAAVDLAWALNSARSTIVFSSTDWGSSRDFAWLYGLLVGWDNDDGDPSGGDVGQNGSALDELATRFGWSADDVALLRRLHAAVAAFDKNPGVVAVEN